MLQYRSFQEIVDHSGLRIVMVQGMPSPWAQAAKTIFEVKGLEYVAAPWVPGEANDEIAKWGWGGQRADRRMGHRKTDQPVDGHPLPERAARAKAVDDSARRDTAGIDDRPLERDLRTSRHRMEQAIAAIAPMLASGNPPPQIARMGGKYGYNEADAKAAGERTAQSLKALDAQLKSQYARGVHFFVGDALSALDIYWTAFANLLDPLPKEQCPMPEAYRPGFTVNDPVVKEALTPLLFDHRSRIFGEYFRNPMEL
jgi:hypothetical protein